MITKFDIGEKWSGQNLGNQLFQIASQFGLAKRYNTELLIPKNWKYGKYFSLLPEVIVGNHRPTLYLKEPAFEYSIDFFDQYSESFRNQIVNVGGVLQSEKYWKPYEHEVRALFSFDSKLYNTIRAEQEELIRENPVAISVRRGDFITNPNHYLLPFNYYYEAYEQYFPGSAMIIFTDDFTWCKRKFGKLKNVRVYYSDSYNAIEQLCFMSMFSRFIIANSTFSWWGAYLSADPQKKVVRPYYVFDGPKKEELNIKDHYPPEWIEYRHKEIKMSRWERILFHNDNRYRIKSWSRQKLFYLYTKLPFKEVVKKAIGKK